MHLSSFKCSVLKKVRRNNYDEKYPQKNSPLAGKLLQLITLDLNIFMYINTKLLPVNKGTDYMNLHYRHNF